jgi:hypothetical protein
VRYKRQIPCGERLARRGISTLRTEIQAFTLSGRSLKGGGEGLRRAAAKAVFLLQQRPETEIEHDAFDEDIAPDEAVFVIPDAIEKALMRMGDLVQEDFAGDDRRGQSDFGGLPFVALFVGDTPQREDADFRG